MCLDCCVKDVSGPYRELSNIGVNPSSVAMAAVATVRAGLAPAAGYAGRWTD